MAESCENSASAVSGSSQKQRFLQRMLQIGKSLTKEAPASTVAYDASKIELLSVRRFLAITERRYECPLPIGIAGDQALAIEFESFIHRVIRWLI